MLQLVVCVCVCCDLIRCLCSSAFFVYLPLHNRWERRVSLCWDLSTINTRKYMQYRKMLISVRWATLNTNMYVTSTWERPYSSPSNFSKMNNLSDWTNGEGSSLRDVCCIKWINIFFDVTWCIILKEKGYSEYLVLRFKGMGMRTLVLCDENLY